MTKREQQAEQYRQQRLKAEAAIVARRVKFEQDINRMRDNGDLDRCSKLLSMAYQVFTQANSFAEEAVSIMEQYGVVRKKIKTTANNLMQSFDAYDKVMSSMLGTKESREQLCGNFDLLQEFLNEFMNHNIEVKRGPYIAATLFLPPKK
jgi:predicted  nucleic acid-binding Zn-ribbon protein